MKFTEGYWLPSEKANASHAMQAYEVEQIPGGMRILATTRPIEHRGMTLNLPTITVEFVAHTPDTISMEAWHYEAYDNKVPSFDKTESVYEDVTVTINEDEAVLDTGSVQVRVQRKGVFAYTFEADGKVLTGSGFRNLSYIRWNRQQSTMLPAQNYMTEKYQPYGKRALPWRWRVRIRPWREIYSIRKKRTGCRHLERGRRYGIRNRLQMRTVLHDKQRLRYSR